MSDHTQGVLPPPAARARRGLQAAIAVRESIRAEALRLGFARCAFAAAGPPARLDVLDAWLARGMHGEMRWMADRLELRRDVRRLLPGARTVVTVLADYHPGREPPAPGAGPAGSAAAVRSAPNGDVPGTAAPAGAAAPVGDAASGAAAPAGAADPAGAGLRGRVARYARGRDYHLVMRERLSALAAFARERAGAAVSTRRCSDSAPVMEREVAMAAGLGFIGKNTMLIAPGVGSYTLIGELLLDLPLPPDPPYPPDGPRCGACRLCLDACPTGAIVDEHTIDARRCIAYLTIELRGPIPRGLRPLVGDRVFGCDVCQEVCPFNRSPAGPPDPELRARPALSAPLLAPLLRLGSKAYRRFVAGTALYRVRRGQLLRNVCVALGNSGDRSVVPALAAALDDRDRLVRGHAAWALGRLGGPDAAAALRARAAVEPDAWVREEIDAARAATG